MAPRSDDHCARIQLLGGFGIEIRGSESGADGWRARRAVELVQVLALANRHRLLREQVIDMLWPHLTAEAGAANLRKAAHLVRRALGHVDAVVLRVGGVELFPGWDVATDVARFEAAAREALRSGSPDACAAAATEYAFRNQSARLADLLESAVAQHAAPASIAALRTLPADQVFSSADELWAYLPDVPRLCG